MHIPNLPNRDRHSYETLSGETLSLGWLERKQVDYLEYLKASADRGADYFALLALVRGPEAMTLKDFGGQVTPEACQSVFFKVGLDIVERAGIAQGRVLAPEESRMDPNSELLSLSQTAKLLDRSRAAIHLALTKGRIRGWRVGTAWIVDRGSAVRYKKSHPAT
jgi:hypothetical protein